jgi:uncharacterized delta-60 repeat protein
MNGQANRRAMLLALSLLMALPGSLLALTGNTGFATWLDPGFSDDGAIYTDFGEGTDWAYGLGLQGDGKILATGASQQNGQIGIAVARYLANGDLDPTFGINGVGFVSLTGASVRAGEAGLRRVAYSEGRAIVQDAQGRIVVAGSVQFTAPDAEAASQGESVDQATLSDDDFDAFVIRLLEHGELDPSFFGGGVTTVDLAGGDDRFYDVGLQEDGKIVAVGSAVANGTLTDFFAVRLNPDGSFDNLFSGDGKQTIDFAGQHDIGRGLAFTPDGRVVIGGAAQASGNYDFGVAVLDHDGILDTEFSGDGRATRALGPYNDFAHDVQVQQNGRIVLGGYTTSDEGADFGVARFWPKGGNDNTFGDRGLFIADVSPEDQGEALQLGPHGDIMLVGSSYSMNGEQGVDPRATSVGLDTTILCIEPDGTLETGFGDKGVLVVDMGGTDRGHAAAMQPDGKLVTAGYARPGEDDDWSLLRILPEPVSSHGLYLPLVLRNG